MEVSKKDKDLRISGVGTFFALHDVVASFDENYSTYNHNVLVGVTIFGSPLHYLLGKKHPFRSGSMNCTFV